MTFFIHLRIISLCHKIMPTKKTYVLYQINFQHLTRIQHTHAIMAPTWPGFQYLREGTTNKLIVLKDVEDLFEDMKAKKGVTFKMVPPWGDNLMAICRRTSARKLNKAEKLEFKEEQLRDIARLLMQLIQDMACPDKSGRSISSSSSAQIWQENACPMQPKHDVAADVRGEYVRVRFGDRIDKAKKRKELYVLLHRMACWAAVGVPSDKAPLATHSCGNKRCLRLECLKWGDHASNQKDAYKASKGKRWSK
jgi:hypothetical protein